ncbi:MAG: glycosyltransferase [Nitrospiraceae bacterium]|nr:glycosyltransferase [Nitrospiraceae bacterium]
MQKSCIVIPCYNEEKRLPVGEIAAFLRESDSVSLYFVNDGSKDGTARVLDDIRMLGQDRVSVLELPENRGKAEAVRLGILEALHRQSFHIVGYFDADLSAPLTEINLLLEYMDLGPPYEVVTGSRIRRLGARIERRPCRHYAGRVFATCASLILGLPVYDTQCGAKIFRAELAEQIFCRPFSTSWLFDVEIFARAAAVLGPDGAIEKIAEAPLRQWVGKTGSKLRTRHILTAPLELARIYLEYRRG